MAVVLFLLALGAAAAGIWSAEQAGGMDANARRGLAVAEQWCMSCHAVRPGQSSADSPMAGAPAFAVLVTRAGDGPPDLARFMSEQHLPMPTFRLYDDEKEAVLAYFEWLRQRAQAR